MRIQKKLITLLPGSVMLSDLREIYLGGVQLKLDPEAIQAVERAHATVQDVIAKGDVVYGINTGIGKLARTQIPPDSLTEMQRYLVLSHCVGLGDPLPDNVTRLVVANKIISLSRGYSGVRLQLINNLLALFNAHVMPVIPEKGSVGASGDLAPLAHLALMLLGEGKVRVDGQEIPALDGLKLACVEPLVLGPREGVALLNGTVSCRERVPPCNGGSMDTAVTGGYLFSAAYCTQASTALALRGLFEAEKVFGAGLVAGAMSLEAVKGSVRAYDARIHEARGHQGQIDVAAAVRVLLTGSDIVDSHKTCSRVQDSYSIRCVPQVMGACLDNLRHAARVLQIEANSCSDNPLVFSESGDIISGGNFHGEPVAFAADIIALAVAEIGSISERRLALLMDTGLSGLPPFLVNESGIHSGFMTAQVSAAALASENKCLSFPSSVDSIPTSANQEDHVSMATYAARRLQSMCFNTAGVVGIEAMAAVQGMEYHRPLHSSPLLEHFFNEIREHVLFLDKDRLMAPDIEYMHLWASSDHWPAVITTLFPSTLAKKVELA